MTVTIVYGSPQHPDSTITPFRSVVRHTPPAAEPVSLADAKVHCRIDTSDDDAYVTSLITVAREYLEETLDIAILNQTLEARYDVFPLWEIVLPRPPLATGVVTIEYRDEAGQIQTITSANFQVDRHILPGRVYPLYEQVWPAVRGDENSVTVRWPAGYGATGASCPAALRHAIFLLVAHWYEMRQPVVSGYSQVLSVPQTFQTLLAAAGWGRYT
jgi:uncharacterized phiE125 gp8 family phage protein